MPTKNSLVESFLFFFQKVKREENVNPIFHYSFLDDLSEITISKSYEKL